MSWYTDLNNVLKADHGKLKPLIKPRLGLQSLKTAYATLKECEVMWARKKRQAPASQIQEGVDSSPSCAPPTYLQQCIPYY